MKITKYNQYDFENLIVTVNDYAYIDVQNTLLVLSSCFFTALDVQQCGISNRGALAFQSLLRCNKSLVVLDLRINPLIGKKNNWHR